MPNWCENTIKIIGEESALKQLMKKCGLDKEEPDFDFDAIIKTPVELANSTSPLKVVETTEEAQHINNGCNRVDCNICGGSIQAITKKEEKRRFAKYGAIDWCGFRIKNWGTKWSADSAHIHEQVFDGRNSYIIVEFLTPYSPAVGIAKRLIDEGFDITGAYVENGTELHGYYLDRQGDFIIKQVYGMLSLDDTPCDEEDFIFTEKAEDDTMDDGDFRIYVIDW